MRARTVTFLAAILLVLIAGFSAHGPGATAPGPTTQGPLGESSISATTGSDALSVTAIEPGRPVSIVRLESRHAGRAVSVFLVVAVLLVIARAGRSSRALRRVLELTIRTQTEWWRPAPGGRAPPRASTV